MKILFTLTLSLLTFLSISAQEVKSDCKAECKVSKIVEEGVFLGVQITDNPTGEQGAKIIKTFTNTAAEKSGLKVNDFIMKINNIQIKDKTHLVEVIQTYKAGDKVLITYRSTNDKVNKIKVRLGAKSTRVVEEMICCDQVKNEVQVVEGIEVYPIPASTTVQIKTREAIEGDAHIMIYDMNGKEMYYDFANLKGALDLKINVSDFTNGTYMVRVESAKANYISKIVVAK